MLGLPVTFRVELDTGSTCNIDGGGLDTGSTCNIEGGWILGLPVTLRGAGYWVYL